jgi:hypothetical protein
MLERFRSVMKAIFAVQVGIPLLILFVAGPVSLIWMIFLIAQGQLEEAAQFFGIVLIFAAVFAFMLWVRKNAQDVGNEIDKRRLLRAADAAGKGKATSPRAGPPPPSGINSDLKYEVKEIPLPMPPPTDPSLS